MQGTIKNVYRDREFGFIISDDGGADMYFHRSNVQSDTFARLASGQRITFEVKSGNQGKSEAFNLVIEPTQNSPQPIISEPMSQTVATVAPNFARDEVKKSAPAVGYGEPRPLPPDELAKAIQEAFAEKAAHDGWANLASIGAALKGRIPGFQPWHYGYESSPHCCDVADSSKSIKTTRGLRLRFSASSRTARRLQTFLLRCHHRPSARFKEARCHLGPLPQMLFNRRIRVRRRRFANLHRVSLLL